MFTTDGHILQSDMRRKVFANGSLEIVQVVKTQEEGKYSCEAKNRQGQSSKAATHLQVMGKFKQMVTRQNKFKQVKTSFIKSKQVLSSPNKQFKFHHT
jgi:hypothetical protein